MKRLMLKWTGVVIMLLFSATGFAQETLSKAPYVMDTLVVTAKRTEEPLRDVSQNITVFTQTDIERSGAVSVTDLLKKAGIQVYHDGGAGYGNDGVVIRGGRTSMHGFDIAGDILVLVDGHRTGSDFLGNIGLENTERIEVIRGPGAVQYGAAAMGGVINIITRQGKEKTAGSVEAGIGSWGEQRYKAGISGKTGRLDFAGSMAYFSRDDYELGNGDTYENSDVEDRVRYSFNTGWHFNDNHRLGLIVQGSDTNGAGKGEDAAKSYYYYTRQDRDNHTWDLSYKGNDDTGSTTWLTRYFQGEVNYDLKRLTRSSTTRLPLSNNTNRFQGSQAQVSHDFGLLRTIAGMDWMAYEFDQRQDGDAASASTQNTAQSDFDNISGFLMGDVHLLENRNLVLSAGIRYDLFDVSVNAWKIEEDVTVSREVDKHAWTPAFGIAYSPVDALKIRANYARAFKMPLPRQLTGYTVMMSTPFIGNPDLEPEKSDNFDLGVDLDWQSLFVSATWFYSDYQDMIGYETHNSVDAHYSGRHYWYYNVNSAEIQGIELGVKMDLARTLGWSFHLEPYVNWTHLLVFEDENGFKLANRSRDSLAAGLVFGSGETGLTASLEATYYGTQYAVDRESGSSTVQSQEKLDNVGNAWVIDFSCSQRLVKFQNENEIRLKGSIHNLFDELYSTDEDDWMPGRSFYLGVEYRM